MRALLISTYDLGRQPFGLASPAAWLREAGVDVCCADLSRQKLNPESVRLADFVGFYLPMHTATRLALPVIDRVRALQPAARLAAFGLYAPLNEKLLREHGVTDVLGGEFEEGLVRACLRDAPAAPDARGARPPDGTAGGTHTGGRHHLPRLAFRVPYRDPLPPLERYAALQVGDERRTAGYTEASRGCKHRCRHCPVVPVYDGRFRVVPRDVVLADIDAQVAAGARHITFGDPDFFNGVRHAVAIVEALAGTFPEVTYDVTIKIEHLLRHADLLPVLSRTGCAFVTSAVESLDDEVLAKLQKGHTRADFERVVEACRANQLTLVPTFVAFTPWTTVESYLDLLHAIERLDLIEHVAPIQLTIRLLIPQGSRLLELPEVRARISRYDPRWLAYMWTHADPSVDALQKAIETTVGLNLHANRRETFARVWTHAHECAGIVALPPAAVSRAAIPYLNEPWYC